MKFCYQLQEACCCVPISNATCAYLFHLFVHGCVAAIYIFTTDYNPSLGFVDYFFVWSAVSLAGLSFLTMFFIKIRKVQFVRAILGLLVAIGIICSITGTIWYTIVRWDTEMKTLILKGIRPRYKSKGDPFWYIWLVFCWLVSFLSFYYLICILSCMCNPYNMYLFKSEYKSPVDERLPDTSIEVNRYRDMYRTHKPYPVQT